jgi:hypothetical protein
MTAARLRLSRGQIRAFAVRAMRGAQRGILPIL